MFAAKVTAKEFEPELPITPTAPRARSTSDINENDAKSLIAIASFESLELQMQSFSPTF